MLTLGLDVVTAKGYSVGGIGEGVIGTFGLLERNFGK